jgi:hypothetical protein
VGSLASELAPHAAGLSARPRIYADANVPVGLVAYMRRKLHWDVLHVLEDADLRRASDVRHFHLAQQLRRTLITLDRDYLDDRRFPPGETGGVLVIDAPNEREFSLLLKRLDEAFFPGSGEESAALPLEGRKLHVHTDWGREESGFR